MAELFYNVAVFPDDRDPYQKKYDTLEALARFIRTLSEGERRVAWYGEMLYVTEGQFRFLVHGDQQVPLFDPPKIGKIDKLASLGLPSNSGDPTDPVYRELMKEIPILPDETKQPDEDDGGVPTT